MTVLTLSHLSSPTQPNPAKPKAMQTMRGKYGHFRVICC